MELSAALARARAELSREINPVLMTPEEFNGKVASGNHFLLSVLGGPKTFLVGDARDLEARAGRGEAEKA
jgi:hypothetical protein